MRLSAVRADPGYREDYDRFTVRLDGVPVHHCIVADEDEGFVTVIAQDDYGNFLATETGYRTKTLRGQVLILRRQEVAA